MADPHRIESRPMEASEGPPCLAPHAQPEDSISPPPGSSVAAPNQHNVSSDKQHSGPVAMQHSAASGPMYVTATSSELRDTEIGATLRSIPNSTAASKLKTTAVLACCPHHHTIALDICTRSLMHVELSNEIAKNFFICAFDTAAKGAGSAQSYVVFVL